jgi:hypothetical protein
MGDGGGQLRAKWIRWSIIVLSSLLIGIWLIKQSSVWMNYSNDRINFLVSTNMRLCRNAAESYAAVHDGNFPTQVDAEFKSYFPNGEPLVNPVSGMKQWPISRRISESHAASLSKPMFIGIGLTEYCVVINEKNQPRRRKWTDYPN